ncbi:hypothetical protein C9374_010986 [Naegleria lovaniensis]|uniref:AMP-dependent synthetase/ligase domain-containing protein n=1 Tax=Naegleria lovaniensis TaxID=51637 RepID=A0AA88KF07_NAELO|nr:uncharacterized protein C9374_010986 [Naegleria lovaniensis]KAG2374149.1 hypothetical protein C9374_010986 [Naegleria lovaniensis]
MVEATTHNKPSVASSSKHKGSCFRWLISFLEAPLTALLAFILNWVDYLLFLIMYHWHGKTYLVHDLRGDMDSSLLAAPYFPTSHSTKIKNPKEYFDMENKSPIYRHLMSHTRDGSLVEKESVLDELLPPSTRDQLFHQVDEQYLKVKHLLQQLAEKENISNLQHVDTPWKNLEYPDFQLTQKDQRLVPETLFQYFKQCMNHYADKPCVGQRVLRKMHSKEVNAENGKKKVWYTPEFENEAVIYTYRQFEERVDALARAMQKCFNLESSGGDLDFFTFDDDQSVKESEQTRNSRFAIYDDTSYEWFVTALALFQQNVSIVTVYASLGIDSLIQALNESKVSGVMLHFSSLKEVVPKIASQCPRVKYILYNLRMCENSSDEVERREKLLNELTQKYGQHLVLTNIEEMIEMGLQDCRNQQHVSSTTTTTEFKIKGKPHTSKDVCILMYTSGSTSAPKGVLLTHHNLLSAIASFNVCLGVERSLEYIHVAYLPLAHILEILVHSIIFLRGGMIGYSSARTLSEGTCLPCGDLKFWRPSLLVGVPKVFDTIKKGAQLQLHSIAEKRGPFLGWLVNTLFTMAYQCKRNALKMGRDTPFWNWLVFKKFTDGVGGRLKLMLSGGSALIPETQEFLRIGFNCVFMQGYGLTETCAGSTVSNAYFPFETCHCGPPVPCVEIQLVDVPEMGYTHRDLPNPRGELWVRGENVTLGYYKQKDLTLEAYGKLPNFDQESEPNSFFRTGDIVEILPNGFIRVVDRVKNLTKLQHGEYIALNKLESIFADSPYIQPNGILVYGDSFRDYAVALALPQMKYLESVAREKGIEFHSNLDLIQNPQLLKLVLRSLDELADQAKLASFERVKKIYLCEEEWTVENGLLTATQKLKRHAIVDKYKRQIENMYQE